MKQISYCDNNYQDEGHGHEIYIICEFWPVNPCENTSIDIVHEQEKYFHMTGESEK